jgi:hypothetical protein
VRVRRVELEDCAGAAERDRGDASAAPGPADRCCTATAAPRWRWHRRKCRGGRAGQCPCHGGSPPQVLGPLACPDVASRCATWAPICRCRSTCAPRPAAPLQRCPCRRRDRGEGTIRRRATRAAPARARSCAAGCPARGSTRGTCAHCHRCRRSARESPAPDAATCVMMFYTHAPAMTVDTCTAAAAEHAMARWKHHRSVGSFALTVRPRSGTARQSRKAIQENKGVDGGCACEWRHTVGQPDDSEISKGVRGWGSAGHLHYRRDGRERQQPRSKTIR